MAAGYNGAVVVTPEAVGDMVHMATNKVSRDNHTRQKLMRGACLRDVYEKSGVL